MKEETSAIDIVPHLERDVGYHVGEKVMKVTLNVAAAERILSERHRLDIARLCAETAAKRHLNVDRILVGAMVAR